MQSNYTVNKIKFMQAITQLLFGIVIKPLSQLGLCPDISH